MGPEMSGIKHGYGNGYGYGDGYGYGYGDGDGDLFQLCGWKMSSELIRYKF